VRDLLDTIAAACAGVDGLEAAIVFGSVLESRSPEDLDLALLWRPDLPDRERWRRAEAIAADAEHRPGAGGLVVDVKDLRRLPLVLQHRVLRDGKAVYVADRRALVRFTSETVPRALDFLPAYRRMLEASARSVARVGS
jgi:predicted nucleotidyltransferase